VIYMRAPEHAQTLVSRLTAALGPALLDRRKQALLAPLVHKAAFVEAISDAWTLIALTTLAALVVRAADRGGPNFFHSAVRSNSGGAVLSAHQDARHFRAAKTSACQRWFSADVSLRDF
jgi:hypothetical protein